MEHDDFEFVKRTLTGEQEAFGKLFNRYQEMAYRLAMRYVRNFADAQDVTQEAFIRAYRSLGTLNDPAKFVPWLRTIVINLCKTLQKKRWLEYERMEFWDTTPGSEEMRRLITLADDAPTPEQLVEQQELAEIVRQAIERLSERNRIAVLLFYIDGLSYREISDFLQLPLSTIKGRLNKARRQLKTEISSMMKEGYEFMKPEKQSATIRGTIKNADGHPIKCALVLYGSGDMSFYDGSMFAAMTDSDGIFCIEDAQLLDRDGKMREGQIKIFVEGYASNWILFMTSGETPFRSTLPERKDISLDIRMNLGANISGRVVDEHGLPVEGAEVEAWKPLMREIVTTDVQGRYQIYGLNPKRRYYNISASRAKRCFAKCSKSRKKGKISITLDKAGDIKAPDIVMESVVIPIWKNIRGRVTDETGKPIANASVIAGECHTVGGFVRTKTDDDGHYIISDTPEELVEIYKLYIVVEAEGYAPDRAFIDLRGDKADFQFDFTLRKGQRIAGRVIDVYTGEPVKDAVVFCNSWHKDEPERLSDEEKLLRSIFGEGAGEPNFPGVLERQVPTDADGKFCMEDLPDAPLQIYVFPKGYTEVRDKIIDAGRMDLTLEVQKAGFIAGKVVDAETQKPIPQFTLRIHAPRRKQENDIAPGGLWVRWSREGCVFTSGTGEFIGPALNPDSVVDIAVTAEGYAPKLIERAQVKQEPEKLLIKLDKAKTITGVVIDANTGKPIYEVVVRHFNDIFPLRFPCHRYRWKGMRGGEVSYSKSDGSFTIGNLGKGRQYLYVNHTDYAPALIYLGEKSVFATVPMPRGGKISGHVYKNESSVSGCEVALKMLHQIESQCEEHEPFESVELTRTDTDGYFEFTHVASGKYSLSAGQFSFTNTGFLSSSNVVEIELADGEEIVQDLTGEECDS